MSRARGTIQAFGLGVVFAAAAILAACGGGSGDVTGPPGGTGPVDSLVLNLDSADVIVGDTVRLTAEARDANGQVVPGVRLSYASSDPAVATVSDDGLVTSVDLGVAEIEVAIAGEAGIRAASLAPSFSATMANPRSTWRMVSVPQVVITPGEQTLNPDDISVYSARLTNISGGELRSRPEWTWSSSDPSVASIDRATGLVTTLNEGDTWITVRVKLGALFRDVARVPLHVAVCGGIFRVTEWLATGDVDYKASGTAPEAQATYSVDHTSTGTATLKKVPGPSSSDSTVWEGNVTGSVALNNSITFPVPPPVNTGVTTEAKSGEIQSGPTAFARLTVKKPSGDSRACTYDFQYGDYFTWDVTNNQGAPPIPKTGPVGIARLVGKQVGMPSLSGQWVLGSVEPGSEVPLPARAFPDLSASHYTVGSTVGVSMIIALGGASATYGQATFSHILIGRGP